MLPRIITGILIVPFISIVVWYGSVPFLLFVAAICLLSVWEYSVMADEAGYPNQLFLGLLGVGLILLSLYFDGISMGRIQKTPSPFFILIFWCFISFLRELIRKDKGHSYLIFISTLSGVILFGLLLGHLLLLRDLRFLGGEGVQMAGKKITFFLIIVIWLVDTGAWFVGKLMGKSHLAPVVSPKKTWEGAIGGTIIACLAAFIFREAFLKVEMARMEAIFYAIIISVTAQFSDLIESLLKRSFGAKDSSQILPGHGGILDRFDSFIFSAPFFYYLLLATGRFQ
ncbi:MAG: phosphatidate cytidylyltransferase [Elusimicrobiota bacterium]